MGSNADTVKQGYEAFSRGDLEGAMANFDDDIRWDNPEAPQLPYNGIHEGKEAVRELLAAAGTLWEKFDLTPDEFIESGDTVVVLSHADVKGEGGEARVPFVHVWRMSGGKAKKVLALTDTALAAQSLGKL